MPYVRVSSLLHRGKPDEALQVVLDDRATRFSEKLRDDHPTTVKAYESADKMHATELLWIAGAFVRQGNWQDGATTVMRGYKLSKQVLGKDPERLVKVMLSAARENDLECMKSREYLLERFVPAAAEDMRMKGF